MNEQPQPVSPLDIARAAFGLWRDSAEHTRPARRLVCSTENCDRPIVPHPDWDPYRPIQQFLPPADLCAGHGEVWVAGEALATGLLTPESADLRHALMYAQQAFKQDSPPPIEAGHFLYRFWNADGQLLYVGETNDPMRRWREHSQTKPWFSEVVTFTRESFPDREAARKAELAAIRTERPQYNIAGRKRSA